MKADRCLDLGDTDVVSELIEFIENTNFVEVRANKKLLYSVDIWEYEIPWFRKMRNGFEFHFGNMKDYYLTKVELTFKNYNHVVVNLKVKKKRKNNEE